jgi:hypothetical protein
VSVTRTKLTGIAVGGALVMVALGLATFLPRDRDEDSGASGASGTGLPRFSITPQSPGAPDFATAGAPVPEPVVGQVMQQWRSSILERDADGVLTCDRLFRDHPRSFAPALRDSATRDSDERVRAFSTRVLGKLRDPALAPFFLERLQDASAFVRENSAWALGELRATEAMDDLAALKHDDPAPAVRKAAELALDQQQRPRR